MKSILGGIIAAGSGVRAGGNSPISFSARGQRFSVPMGYGGARATLLGAMGSNGTLFATVNRTSNATSQVKWRLWRKSKSGRPEDRTEVTTHLSLDVWNKPNDFFTQQLFIETFQQHMDLVGEGWWVIAHNQFGWPESMWAVRPDRVAPVPDPQAGVAGYVYTDPNGEQVPLGLNEVIRLRMPNPSDPGPAGRGMGAVQSILAQVEAVHFSSQWNRNFFLNSAVPGGVITTPTPLDDGSFKRMQMQWSDNHLGISAAHRVAILEGGAEFHDAPTQRDMQFVELLNVSRDVIREAFGMPKFMLGMVDDVNRATAEASDAMFGSWLLVPRLERIKGVLNSMFLPQFGPFGHGTGQPDVEFDYDTPVPPNAEAENAALTAKTNAYVALTTAGVDPVDAAQVVGLPPMEHVKPEPAPAPTQEEPVPAGGAGA